MGITAQEVIEEARFWLGYREKNHASANLTNFLEDAGDGNYTIFSVICGYGIQPWQWCQMFVCSMFALVCGGSIEDAKKILCDTDDNGVLTSYTPTGAQYFKNAGRWHTIPEPGDVVYFYGYVSSEGRSRICHTGIVEWVDAGSETFGTIEGNSNFDGFTTNGGSVARHEYSYAAVGGDNRVNGFGRPRYDAVSGDDDAVTIMCEVNMRVRFNPCKIGDKGTNVLLVQEILKARGLYDGDLDGDFGTITDDAVREYQRLRIEAGADIGGSDGQPDGEVGWNTFNDMTALPSV